MSDRITVHRDQKPIYDIVMDRDFEALPLELERLKLSGRRVCIVTDTNVAPLYLKKVKEIFEGCGLPATEFIFPAG